MTEEIWRDIEGYEGHYQISNFGRVKSFKKGERILKLGLNSGGYLQVSLRCNDKVKNAQIHRLVALAFIPNPDSKPQVNHIDGNKTNNCVDNLEWVTPSENIRHAVTTGLIKQNGEASSCAKLTNEQARYIRDNPNGLTVTELARLFQVSVQTISRIQTGKTYKTASGVIRTEKLQHPPHISKTKRKQIQAKYKCGVRGYGSYTLAKEFGVNPSTILNIVNEK